MDRDSQRAEATGGAECSEKCFRSPEEDETGAQEQ